MIPRTNSVSSESFARVSIDDPLAALDATKGFVVILPTLVQPHSEGSVTLESADPTAAPKIDLNYFDAQHDVDVMISIMRRGLEIARSWPGDGLGGRRAELIASEHDVELADFVGGALKTL